MSELDKLIAAANAVCADIEDLGYGGTADSYRESFVAIAKFSDEEDLLQDLRWTVDNARHELAVISKHVEREDRLAAATERAQHLADSLTPRLRRPKVHGGTHHVRAAWAHLVSTQETETK